jgi:hypothetical protein
MPNTLSIIHVPTGYRTGIKVQVFCYRQDILISEQNGTSATRLSRWSGKVGAKYRTVFVTEITVQYSLGSLPQHFFYIAFPIVLLLSI